MSRWTKHGIAVVVVGLLGFAVERCGTGRERAFDTARDSVTVRAYLKYWGGYRLDLGKVDVEWRPDSQTVRTRSADTFTVQSRQVFPKRWRFSVVRVLSQDSVWVRALDLERADECWTWRELPSPDSVLLTRQVRWWTTPSVDAGRHVGLRMAPEGSRRRTPGAQRPTYRVVGRVVDARSGLPCRIPAFYARPGAATAMIREAWGAASADADSLGRFELNGLHEGWVKLNVSSFDYSFASRVVHVPGDSVMVKLIPGSPLFLAPVVVVPAAGIPVPIPGVRQAPMHAPTASGIGGLWRGESKCVDGPRIADCVDERGLFRFTVLMDSAVGCPCRAEWRLERDDALEHTPLEPGLSNGASWVSAHPTEPGNLAWEFFVADDTLVGQLIDPSTRTISREFWARRVPN